MTTEKKRSIDEQVAHDFNRLSVSQFNRKRAESAAYREACDRVCPALIAKTIERSEAFIRAVTKQSDAPLNRLARLLVPGADGFLDSDYTKAKTIAALTKHANLRWEDAMGLTFPVLNVFAETALAEIQGQAREPIQIDSRLRGKPKECYEQFQRWRDHDPRDLTPGEVWDAMQEAGDELPNTRPAFVRAVNRAIKAIEGPRRDRAKNARSVIRSDRR